MTPVLLLALLIATARAETHTVEFVNECGFGTEQPTFVQGGRVLSTGGELHHQFTINGPLLNGIAYLQTGACGTNGEGCTTVQTNLTNGMSCAEVSLVPPHAFSVSTGFGFFGGCEGVGQDCTSPTCAPAFQGFLPGQPDEVCCSAANVNLAITFCD
ncbi:hypothetical protein C8R44DRAFT_883387 [Mycena epipterygia]|nr:hypothetical protein C8R44DRAFT_883387 [Mycena epipterygia]